MVLETPVGKIALLEAGDGDPVVCLHRLGGTKDSFRATVAELGDAHRVIALDLPGFGESDKPLGAPYDVPWLAGAVAGALDALRLERVHLVGNSLGGRIALELGLAAPGRVGRIVLLNPALAWRRRRGLATPARLVRPELAALGPWPGGLLEGAARRLVPAAQDGWQRERVDEYLRSCRTARGRAALLASARALYLDEPHGRHGLWTRLAGLSVPALFVWGRRDAIVPIAFRRHVERVLPAARHMDLNCGHVPHLEMPHETHAAIRGFLAS